MSYHHCIKVKDLYGYHNLLFSILQFYNLFFLFSITEIRR